MEEIKSREKETEGKEYAGHLISGRKCGKMKNTHKIRGRKERGGNKVKKIVKVLISRLFITVLLILLQFGYLFYLLLEVGKMSTYINLILNILAFIVALFVVNRRMNPAYRLAWVFIILMFPLLGLLLYVVFGRPELTRKAREKMNRVNEEVEPLLTEDRACRERLAEEDPVAAGQSAYISDWAHFPVYEHTATNYYPSGEEMFPVMLEEIRKAKKFVFLEYFILDDGKMFRELIQLLKEKVEEGVEVRLIYDDVGCITTLPNNFYKELQKIGIKCAAFNPLRARLAVIMNNRDHRKILVIDGNVAFTGGINIADEYINEIERFGYWKDTGIRMKGAAVWSFTGMFLEMWNYIINSTEDYEKFRPDADYVAKIPSVGYVQPYSDTPLDHENTGENVYMNIINSAQKYVYIFTPYLIIDHEMLVSLQNAAKRGVDVRIVTPGIPDKKFVYLLTQADYGVLIESGVRIYQYTPGFIHAKSFVCDDKIATVGSINLDYRSMYLHFECGVWCYKTEAVLQLKEDALAVIGQSQQIDLEFCKHRFVGVRMIQTCLRLLAPLL